MYRRILLPVLVTMIVTAGACDSPFAQIGSLEAATGKAVAVYNLTGLWNADDGGLYYIRQVGDQVWWAGFTSTNSTQGYLDFFKGLHFVNVFRGTLSRYTNQRHLGGCPTWRRLSQQWHAGTGDPA